MRLPEVKNSNWQKRNDKIGNLFGILVGLVMEAYASTSCCQPRYPVYGRELINSILSGASEALYRSAERKKLFVALRTRLVAHTNFELEHFYCVIRQNTKIDKKLRNVFDGDLLKAHKQVLYLIGTIIEFDGEKKGDLEYVSEMIRTKIDIEEEVLFPVYDAYCK